MQELQQQISPDLLNQLHAGGRNPHSDEFATRWLVSRSWDVSSTVQAVSKHCEWLVEQAAILPAQEAQPPSALGENADELFLQGCDDVGRPVMLCNLAAHQPSQDKKSRQHALIWCMEHLVELADKQLQTSKGQAIIIFDLQGYTMENVDTEDAAAIVDILQKQYPERLGQLFIYEAPTVFWALWNMIWPFLTASTREKVQLVSGDSGLEAIHSMVPHSILPPALGGTSTLKPFIESVRDLRAQEGSQPSTQAPLKDKGLGQKNLNTGSHARHSSIADSVYSDATCT